MIKLPPSPGRTARRTLLWFGLLVATVAPIGSAAHGAVVRYDFNTAGSLVNDFNLLNDTNNFWSQPLTGGLSDSGNLAIASSGTANTMTSSVVAKQGFAQTGDPFTLSVYFQARDGGSTGFQWIIGVVPTATTAPSVSSGQATLQLGVGLNLGSTGYRWGEFNNTTIAGKNAAPSNVFSLTEGNWYYFEANYSRTGNDWTLSYSIHNANNNGTLPASSLISETTSTFTNSELAASNTLHPFLAVANNPAGRVVNRFDDFTITAIPEPGTFALLAASLVLLAGARWRGLRRHTESGR